MSQNRFFVALTAAVFSLGLAAGESPTFTYTAIDHPNAKSTSGSGINARGDIVGSYTDQANVTRGFLLRDGNFATISFPGAVATQARGINSKGDIVGTHQGPNLLTPGSGGDIHGFLLPAGDSVPEPIDYPGHMNTITQRITATGICGDTPPRTRSATICGKFLTPINMTSVSTELANLAQSTDAFALRAGWPVTTANDEA